MSNNISPRVGLFSLIFFASIILIVVFNTPLAGPDRWLSGVFPATAGLMTAAFIAIGLVLNRRVAGLIVDNRNRMSLSKLQMLAWTLVVVSALTASAAYNVRNGLQPAGSSSGPLEINIPTELLFAMGIAATSFIATPTILSLKAQETPASADVVAASTPATPGASSGLQNSGKVHGRTDPSLAKWSDLFRGDEVGNCDTPDLSKIQQFAITLLLVGIYSSQVIAMFGDLGSGVAIKSLPVLGPQFVVLMGISHASYLVYKAAPHTASGDPQVSTIPAATPPVVRVDTAR